MRKSVRVITCEERKQRFINAFSNQIDVDHINDLTDGAYSHNSLLAMGKDWNLFCEFCDSKSVRSLPAAATAVRLFIEKESKSRKYSTIKRYVVTISLVHRLLSLPDPVSSVSVRNTLAALRINKKHDSHSTNAFNRQHLDELTLLLHKSKNSKDIRNLAIYHIMFECMLKRSELRDLMLESVYSHDARYYVVVGSQEYQLSVESSQLLKRWLEVRGDCSGALFTAIDKYGNLSRNALNDSSIYRILRAASDKLMLDVHFSGQSLRVGAASDLASQGVKVKEIQRYGRWKSAAMPYQYVGNRSQAALERMVYKSFKPWDK
ncbi:tyrosine-type recombinase/integrase [Vibrio sp. M260118]|uniref:tyrosine-type recombinase/integrase n=1 Tax=Vibrio sp. M260118 TaxID=3020896 RepID=UPI002F3EDBC1